VCCNAHGNSSCFVACQRVILGMMIALNQPLT
jgi:hypothetical protein